MLSEISQAEKNKYKMTSLILEYNKAKQKEQNSSRLTDFKRGLVVTEGEGCGRAGGEGRRRGLRGIMIGTHGVRGHREDRVAQRR